jgi:hypothetical protein
MRSLLFTVLIAIVIILTACKSSSEPVATKGGIKGIVRSIGQGGSLTIYPAYIFHEESLLITTNRQGTYAISDLEAGLYTLTCSALGYRDTVQVVHVTAGATNEVNFFLLSDTITAKVRGEFQDLLIFNDALVENPDLKDWDAREIFIGLTGATIHEMGLQRELPERRIYLGDSLITIADDWGQYWFEVQCGTYPLRGTCEGYQDDPRIFKVRPGQDNYLNFFLIEEMEEQ